MLSHAERRYEPDHFFLFFVFKHPFFFFFLFLAALQGVWDLSFSTRDPISVSALEQAVLTTGPPGKPQTTSVLAALWGFEMNSEDTSDHGLW